MSTSQVLPISDWAHTGPGVEPPGLWPAWHPRTLWTGAAAVAATVRILPRLGRADDPASLLSHWSRSLLRALHVQVELAAPLPEGAQIWVANHLSWLDPAVLMAERPMGTLAKAEVAGYPLLGGHARRAGLRFVDRGDPTHRAAVLIGLTRHWQTGAPFLLFPEGTTTCGAGLAPLHEGGLRAAFRLGLSVLPLRLESPDVHYAWTGEAALAPHLRTLCRARRTRVQVRPGTVMAPTGNEDAWLRALRLQLAPPMV